MGGRRVARAADAADRRQRRCKPTRRPTRERTVRPSGGGRGRPTRERAVGPSCAKLGRRGGGGGGGRSARGAFAAGRAARGSQRGGADAGGMGVGQPGSAAQPCAADAAAARPQRAGGRDGGPRGRSARLGGLLARLRGDCADGAHPQARPARPWPRRRQATRAHQPAAPLLRGRRMPATLGVRGCNPRCWKPQPTLLCVQVDTLLLETPCALEVEVVPTSSRAPTRGGQDLLQLQKEAGSTHRQARSRRTNPALETS